MEQVRKRIGIMGGTFNPIHIGHLILAEKAYETMNLDKVWIVPTANPPHKQGLEILSKEHRLEMVKMAISDNPHFKLSLMEMEGETPRYSYETMEWLNSHYQDCEFYYLLGADSLFDIEKWREFERFMKATHILVAVRNEQISEDLEAWVTYLKKKYNARISFINSPNIGISSSLIRELVKEKKSIRYYVPDSVYQYIKREHLYGC